MSDGYVYVVGSGQPGDPVKIGWSQAPEARVKQFQVGAPYVLQLLDKHPGPGGLEKFLHDEFAPLRVHGEWFLIEDPVLRIAEKVRTWPGEVKVETPRKQLRLTVHLDRLLVERGMSVKELADAIGIHPNNVSKLKNNRVEGVKFETLAAICEVLRCYPGDLLGYDLGPLGGQP